jgi:hypothetical protein
MQTPLLQAGQQMQPSPQPQNPLISKPEIKPVQTAFQSQQVAPGSQTQTPTQPHGTLPFNAAPTQPPRTSYQIATSIEACINANPVHKSNVRYLIEAVKTEIEGPPNK